MCVPVQIHDAHRERIRLLYEQQQRWETADDKEKGTLAAIYTRYIFSALSRNCDKRAGMTHADRKAFLQEVFGGLFLGRLICLVQTKLQRLFVLVKQVRK